MLTSIPNIGDILEVPHPVLHLKDDFQQIQDMGDKAVWVTYGTVVGRVQDGRMCRVQLSPQYVDILVSAGWGDGFEDSTVLIATKFSDGTYNLRTRVKV